MNEVQHSDTQIREATARPRRRSVTWVLGGMVLLLLSVLVALQVYGIWSVVTPDTASDTLVLYALSSLNFIAFVIFAFIFVRSLLKLRRERKAKQLGSKLKTRLVVHFIGISLLPITAMAVFSYLYFNRSIEKWFYKGPEDALKEAQDVQTQAAQRRNQQLMETAAMLGAMVDRNGELIDPATFADLVQKGDLSAIRVLRADGSERLTQVAQLNEQEQSELNETLRLAAFPGVDATLTDGVGFDAVVAPLTDGGRLVLVPSKRSGSALDAAISNSRTEYQKLVARQRRVRLLGLSTLGLLTLLLIFAATWIAIHLARGIAGPILALAEAAKEVARGNLSYRVSSVAEDELAILADSFNQMTAELAENRDRIESNAEELREKNLALEERREYIETVLESLNTGVISLDESDRVTTVNAAAAGILGLGDRKARGHKLSEITSPDDCFVLERLMLRARRIGRAADQTELLLQPGSDVAPVPVAITATALRAEPGNERGVVLVIEDMSELISAQRAAAWSEVARRMAHEIKNPLTPIQLSAERIFKSFHRGENGNAKNGGTGASEAENERHRVAKVVDECTATISREVAGLKEMVDEFSRFARLPYARLEPLDLNTVVNQAVALYEDRLDGVRLDVKLAPSLPPAMLDAEQMKRAFVNLMDNALEAVAQIAGEKRITVATGFDPSRSLILAEVTDNGHGIARKDFPKLFQPHFSTRGRGTGLGLAIVQKIVADHSGRISAESNRATGARFILELPSHSPGERG